jgi:zinc D-Ala-D-Ala carboxypeptidase
MSRKHIVVSIIAILALSALALVVVNHSKSRHITQQPYHAASTSFNKQQYSLSDPASIWVVVNKQRPLNPQTYTPTDLVTPHFLLTEDPGTPEMTVRKDMAEAMGKMYDSAHGQGIDLLLSSGYRSYQDQKETRTELKQEKGTSQADRESARTGYSEHQTGLAADVGVKGAKCLAEPCFANTTAGKWLASNAYKFGFISRYPEGKESVTGYEYEPWHIRYVGIPLATEMHDKNIRTLEEFFNLGPAPDYDKN